MENNMINVGCKIVNDKTYDMVYTGDNFTVLKDRVNTHVDENPDFFQRIKVNKVNDEFYTIIVRYLKNGNCRH